ncbi:ubiquitin-like modifier-activating enzyme 6 [Haliotis cracherodii]|uniref:ubiquitin-like modifier-activating enzyme 6 n=1 Tax=Haliotis cracherodii TaxID=6455 RepID=UPI0039E8D650
MMASEVEIDDTLYSRQRYVLGDSAMKRMAKAAVLIYGMGGLGVEIAKNLVLAGVKSLTIQDRKTATVADLGAQFFLREEDARANRNRAEACCSRLSELNPYVSVDTLTDSLDEHSDLSYLKLFQCIILTECPLPVQVRVNKFCREQSPQIHFISSDVYGVFGSVFVDLGDEFEVVDATGEEPREVFVNNITKATPGVVACLDNQMHGLESDATVTFKEVRGMTSLNGQLCQIKVLTPYTFSICDTAGEEHKPYESGGIIVPVKLPKKVHFKPLESQLTCPSLTIPDLSKFQAPPNLHLAFLALDKFLQINKRLPHIWCANDACQIISMATDLNKQMESKVAVLDEDILRCMSFTSRGCLALLCATMGGFVAQEGLKALTGKFTPLNQMLYLDAMEILPGLDADKQQFQTRGDRYDLLRACVGDDTCQKLANIKLFMIGCGAIGCEMLKNYALLGIGSGAKGKITITDNDLIEKSNLNRQFLFRPHHIRKPKSTTAAQSVLDINPALKIEAQQQKVCPQTEERLYNDAFLESQDIVVNALDNVEARRYVDSRCVTTQRPLLESGTMGTKGHVQVIVPHLTESYGSQRDPPDEDYPYCTVKSFPATIEHCIQWSRDKFEQLFVQKPNLFNKFWSMNKNVEEVVETLLQGNNIENSINVAKLSAQRPYTWPQCVMLARIKFEKYFNHKAKQLLHAFPLDTKLQDGSSFWQSPKRPPSPLEFNPEDEDHVTYVSSMARLLADIMGVPWRREDLEAATILPLIARVTVPPFSPSNKRIETDESADKSAPVDDSSEDEIVQAGQRLKGVCQAGKVKEALSSMHPIEFEKDDDSNSHIDFISTSANLRAQSYSIETADRLKIKRIAGRIVPAIATTTAAVSGLVSIELLKLIERPGIEKYKNCFLNLALPVILLSEPGPVERTVIREGVSFTMWDKWEVWGNKDFTLQQFLHYFKETYGFEGSSVVHGVKMVYMPIMPAHSKRLNMTMVKLLKPSATQKYVDLVVSFDDDNDEDVPGPPVRYYFGL